MPVADTNCHMPEALATDIACGLNALSVNGSSASSVGMWRRSTSWVMWYRYFEPRAVMRAT